MTHGSRSFACAMLAFASLFVSSLSASPRNIIFLLADGTGPEAMPIIRWIKGSRLNLDGILTGAVTTFSSDSIITDSAPGATAYSTGFKSNDKAIAVSPWTRTIDTATPYLPSPSSIPAHAPLATLLEGAKLQGKATGIIATSSIQHASPAAFSAHWHDRNNFAELALQQVHQDMDVVLGGGLKYLLPKGVNGGIREDGRDLTALLREKGYAFITAADQLARVSAPKVWGSFASDSMAFDLDRDDIAPTEPSLRAMTEKAIELLAGSAKGRDSGFFLFVEGSKVDWAAHANDPSGVVSDLLAFDEAVGAALDFARKDSRTLVVAVSDHGTGGITIGVREDPGYSRTDDEYLVAPMRRIRATAEGLGMLLAKDSSASRVRELVANLWGVTDLSDAETDLISGTVAARNQMSPVAGPMLAKRAKIGWSTGGHTGADVPLYAFGPDAPAGLTDNAEIGRLLAGSMGFDFKTLNARLFVEAHAAFDSAGYTVTLDRTMALGPALVVSRAGKSARLPLSGNQLFLGDRVYDLEGLVILAKETGRVYLPAQAVSLIRSSF